MQQPFGVKAMAHVLADVFSDSRCQPDRWRIRSWKSRLNREQPL
jgi:hypothetical protein